MPDMEHPVVITIDTHDLQRLLRELKTVLVAMQEERKKFKRLVKESRQGG